MISNSNHVEDVVQALRIDVDAVQSTGGPEDEVGVVCYAHVSARQNTGYTLTISPGDRSAFIVRVLEGETTTLIARSDEDAIRPIGEPNHVRAECVGATREQPAVVVLYVNGVRIARAEDEDGFPRFDGFGVTVASVDGRTEAFFDDFVVSELR